MLNPIWMFMGTATGWRPPGRTKEEKGRIEEGSGRNHGFELGRNYLTIQHKKQLLRVL
jgi:hypothetical protein